MKVPPRTDQEPSEEISAPPQKITELEPLQTDDYNSALNSLYRRLLSDISLTQKIMSIADVVTMTLGADFTRIWITRPGDLCDRGCFFAPVKDGPDVCREQTPCLHLIASSGRYTHIDGGHRRIPMGAYKIGRVASGEWSHFVTNDVTHDERVHDHEWAKRCGLVSFAGYSLVSLDGRTVGVLAMFSKKAITSSQENLLENFAAIASQVIMVGMVQETLRESEERFRTAIDYTCDWEFWRNPQGEYVYVSPSCLRITGYSAEEFMKDRDLILKIIHPMDRPIFAEHLSREHHDAHTLTFRIIGRRGEMRWIEYICQPVYGDQGDYLGRRASLRDITERKLMEEELRQSRDELEQRVKERTAQLQKSEEISRQRLSEIEGYYETAPVGIGILDPQLRYIRVNQKLAEINGIPQREHIGRTVGEVVNQKAADWFKRVMPRIMQSGEAIKDVEVARDGIGYPGVQKITKASIFPLKDQQGEPVAIGVIVEDITEKKRLEEQLHQAYKMEALGTFAGGIAHDFNNILAAVIGFCELARDKIPETSPAHRHLDRVFTAGLRGRDLVRQILAFSRQTPLEQRALQLGSLVKDTLKFLRASIPATIHIQANTRSSSHFVFADPTQIQQVVMNLCANAAHAMSKSGGTIAIDVGGVSFSSHEDSPAPTLNPGRYVKLSVADTGEGMTADVAGKIFDPFFTTKKPAEGTGLGLSVAHGIVANHGGAITVWSEPGRGSIFTVYLPEYMGHKSLISGKRDAEIPHGHERVLIIEDEEPLAQMVGEILARLGYSVTCKTSSREALALIRQDPPQFDLVITDQTMPEMTGLELAKELRVIRPELPVILCTGFSSQVDAESARQAGISAFAMKPLTRTEIAETIREVLNK
jgi:PAS domain S-box-containing protein